MSQQTTTIPYEEYLPDEFYLAGTGYHVVAPSLAWEDLSDEELAAIKAMTENLDCDTIAD